MFVAVYLIEAKTHTVVPQEFVYQLQKVNLYNYGVNSNQNRLIFFSADFFDLISSGDNPNLLDFTPDFCLPTTNIYPPPNGVRQTCYIARLYKFWRKYKIHTFGYKN